MWNTCKVRRHAASVRSATMLLHLVEASNLTNAYFSTAGIGYKNYIAKYTGCVAVSSESVSVLHQAALCHSPVQCIAVASFTATCVVASLLEKKRAKKQSSLEIKANLKAHQVFLESD